MRKEPGVEFCSAWPLRWRFAPRGSHPMRLLKTWICGFALPGEEALPGYGAPSLSFPPERYRRQLA